VWDHVRNVFAENCRMDSPHLERALRLKTNAVRGGTLDQVIASGDILPETADGTEFGFELNAPLKSGDCFFQTPTARYVVRQTEEPVVEIALDVAPSAAAGIGWAIGNLHLELSAEPQRLIAADDPAIRQLLDRLKVPYRRSTAVFRPGRFARGAQPNHDLGPSHRH